MLLKEIQFIIRGTNSLLIHSDDVLAADRLSEARKAPGRKGVAGDDRDPAWTWKTYLYTSDGHLAWPTQNLMACFRKGGVEFRVKGKKTLKAESQASILFEQDYLPLQAWPGKNVALEDLDAIDDEWRFIEHADAIVKMGGMVLDVRRAKVGSQKHVRVRLKLLPGWSLVCKPIVDVDRIPVDVFKALVQYCGMYCGIGDWRPSSPMAPGSHGRFEVYGEFQVRSVS